MKFIGVKQIKSAKSFSRPIILVFNKFNYLYNSRDSLVESLKARPWIDVSDREIKKRIKKDKLQTIIVNHNVNFKLLIS